MFRRTERYFAPYRSMARARKGHDIERHGTVPLGHSELMASNLGFLQYI